MDHERLLVDEETGECLVHPFFDAEARRFVNPVNNAETGEPEISTEEPRRMKGRRVPFQIPKELKESLSTKNGSSKKSKTLMDLEPVPEGTSFGQINPICLFLPAIFYFRWFCGLLMIFEAVMHVWAHRKNKTLKDASVYFRSPFHAITSEFCGLCQSESCMDRVGKMQQIRMNKFLRQCNYMKRVVT